MRKLRNIIIKLEDQEGEYIEAKLLDLRKPEIALEQNPLVRAIWDDWNNEITAEDATGRKVVLVPPKKRGSK